MRIKDPEAYFLQKKNKIDFLVCHENVFLLRNMKVDQLNESFLENWLRCFLGVGLMKSA